ncbi:MAG: CvpA family protein [Gaiellales bacterium]
MTIVDVLVLAWVALSAVQGARRGLVMNGLGLIGFLTGALIGSRLAPHILPGGAQSPWLPAATMIAALVTGLVAQALAGAAGGIIRGRILRGPLAAVDTAGGLALGGVLGLALVWLAAVVAVQQPSLGLRRDVQHSAILPVLLRAVPATSVLSALAQFDPLPVLPPVLADQGLPAPNPAVLGKGPVRQATRSVVQVEGIACSIGIQGSGWVVRHGLVVTNAHVVAGEQTGPTVIAHGDRYGATVVAVDSGNDIALLRVPGLRTRPLRMAAGQPSSAAVAMIGFPEGGPLRRVPGRSGHVTEVLSPDAYGGHVHLRAVVPLRGLLLHGDSGGPVVDSSGQVVAMMFAADARGDGGFGVPLDAIRSILNRPLHRVPTGPCTT